MCSFFHKDREDKYDPMNFSDDEPVTGNNAETESIPEMSENEDDEDDGPPPLELAGPPELEEIPPHHQEMQPLDDLLNVPFTVFEKLCSQNENEPYIKPKVYKLFS